MKILLISNLYPSKEHPFFGTFVKNFKEQLKRKGFKFKLAVIKGKGNTKLEKILKYISFFKDIFRAIKKNDYDLIYVHYISHSLLPLVVLKKYINKPLIINAHGSDVLVKNKIAKMIQKLVTPIIKRADLVVVPSSYFKNIVVNKFLIDPDKVFISASGGVDTTLFRPLQTDKKVFTIGYVSRIEDGKGWDIFLEAISLLKNKNIQVIIIGGGSQEKLLLSKIIDLKLENKVKYLGVKSHNELPQYFNQMNLFAFTTKLPESLGLVGIEAMACGVPVIGSKVGGLQSYIKSGVNGELFEIDNVGELSEKIEYFIKLDNESLKDYSDKAILTAKKYDSKIEAEKLTIKIKEMIGKI